MLSRLTEILPSMLAVQEIEAVYDERTLRVCGDGQIDEVGLLCPWVLESTGNELLARGAQAFIGVPTRILTIVLLAVVLRWLAHRAIHRLVEGTRRGRVTIPVRGRSGQRMRVLESAPLVAERREQRAATIGSVLRSVVTLVVFGVATAMVLSEVGFDLAPVIASAGIVGVAVGFGAQNLVRDFLSGIFMILEDQYGVGDVIDAGEASGVVEAVALRTTRLRDVNGTVWHIRNGEILRVGNQSQGWSRALLDISVAYDSDLEHVKRVIKAAAESVREDRELGPKILEEPEVWGLERMDPDALIVRLVVKTAPLEQWVVARALRQSVKEAFEREGIEIPLPQRSIWVRTDGPGSPGGGAGLATRGAAETGDGEEPADPAGPADREGVPLRR